MDNQEFFTKSYVRIVKQGVPAYISDVGCMYQTEKGCKCALGIVLKDETIKKLLEAKLNSAIYDPTDPENSVYDIVKHELKGVDGLLIRCVQQAHDDAYHGPGFIEEFKERMASVALDLGLYIPE